MKKLEKWAIVQDTDLAKFGERVNEAVNEMNKGDLEIEIQYKPYDKYLSAFVSGYNTQL